MANYLPPTENLPSFNPSVFDTGDESLTYNKAKKLFLRYPTAQGTENLLDTNINGDLTISNTYGDITVESSKYNVSLISPSALPNYKTTDSGLNVLIGDDIGYQMTGITTESILIGRGVCANENNVVPINNGLLNITAIGTNSLSYMNPDNSLTNNNNAFGHSSGLLLINGSYNTLIGDHTLYDTLESGPYSGSYNSFLGSYSGSTISTVNNSTAIGANAKITDNHQIMLGTENEYVQIPNYIKFPDGTTQDTAGGGGGSGVNTSSTLTGAPYTSAGAGSGATIGGAFTGTGLTAYGVNALSSITSGVANLAIGSNAGENITSGSENVIIGENSGTNMTSGSENIVIGTNSGNSISNSVNNIIIGSYSDIGPLYTNNNNIVIGNGISQEGSNIIQIGDSSQTQIIPNKLIWNSDLNKEQTNAMMSRSTGTYSPLTASGVNSLNNIGTTLTGTNLTGYGVSSLRLNTSGSYNCAIGNNSLEYNTTGIDNTALGELAGTSNSNGGANTYIGKSAGSNNISGSNNVYIGQSAGVLATGSANTSIGKDSGNNITTGGSNTVIGSSTGTVITTGQYNTLIGSSANVSSGNIQYSTAIGTGAIATASNQIVLGTSSQTIIIPKNITFSDNSVQTYAFTGNSKKTFGLGYPGYPFTVYGDSVAPNVINSLVTGSGITAYGVNALNAITSGSYNCAIGSYTLNLLTSGGNNTSLGEYAGQNTSTGSSNTILGYNAGSSITTSNNNVCLGSGANVSSSSITNSVALGTSSLASDSNQIQLGTTSQYVNIPNNLIIQGNVSGATTNKTTLQQSGLAIVGSTTSITNTINSTSNAIVDATYTGTLTSSALNLFTNAVSTTRNAIANTGMTITGSTTSITNTINATSNAITDATYTGTLTSSALNLFSVGVSTTRNVIANTGMTITGSISSITNTTSSLSNIITDGTRTLTSGIVSSVATFKTLAGTGGNSSVINPTTIGVYNVDGTTTSNKTEITTTGLTSYIADANNSAIVNSTNGFTILSGGLGARMTPTTIYLAGSGSLGPSMNRDASTTNSSISTILNTGFTPDTTVGASISLTNSNTGAGLVGGNPIIYERTKATTAVGDIIGSHHYFMKDAGGTRKEYARTTAVVKDATTGSIKSSLDFLVTVSGTLTSAFQINGIENQINAFQPLDMNNNSIVSSTGGITLDTTLSASGNPYITLTPKASTGYIILNNLPTSSSGLPSGAIWKDTTSGLNILKVV